MVTFFERDSDVFENVYIYPHRLEHYNLHKHQRFHDIVVSHTKARLVRKKPDTQNLCLI